jgi:hypothetical protein
VAALSWTGDGVINVVGVNPIKTSSENILSCFDDVGQNVSFKVSIITTFVNARH